MDSRFAAEASKQARGLRPKAGVQWSFAPNSIFMTLLEKQLTWQLEGEQKAAIIAVQKAELRIARLIFGVLEHSQNESKITALRLETLLTNLGATRDARERWTLHGEFLSRQH